MDELVHLIHTTVLNIAQQRFPARDHIESQLELVADLGFSSLDFAQLVAILEIELGIDPFAADVALSSMRTVGDVCAAYQSAAQRAEA